MREHSTRATPDSNHTKASHINARGLVTKIDLESKSSQPQIIITSSESRNLELQIREFIAGYRLPGDTIFSHERENKQGGGVILCIHNSLYLVSV